MRGGAELSADGVRVPAKPGAAAPPAGAAALRARGDGAVAPRCVGFGRRHFWVEGV